MTKKGYIRKILQKRKRKDGKEKKRDGRKRAGKERNGWSRKTRKKLSI